jgi:hypothetical protein
LWSVPIGGGNPIKLAHTLPGITNLVASGAEGVVVLTGQQIGTFSADSGLFSPFVPGSKEDADGVNIMREPIRSYDSGQITVSEIQASIRIDSRGQKREVAPDEAAVWQPSVSHDRKSLVYARSDVSKQ